MSFTQRFRIPVSGPGPRLDRGSRDNTCPVPAEGSPGPAPLSPAAFTARPWRRFYRRLQPGVPHRDAPAAAPSSASLAEMPQRRHPARRHWQRCPRGRLHLLALSRADWRVLAAALHVPPCPCPAQRSCRPAETLADVDSDQAAGHWLVGVGVHQEILHLGANLKPIQHVLY